MLQGGTEYADLKDNVCIFDKHKMCNQCFNCIGIINRKKPEQLSLLETARLMQYKLFNFNLANFENKLNENLRTMVALEKEFIIRLHLMQKTHAC